MFAIIKTGGKQYRVAANDLIEIDRIDGEPGATVAFSDVLMLGGDDAVLGAPMVAGASVAGEVVEQGRKPKVIAFKKRRRKNSRRKRGHRQEFTVVRITEIAAAARKQQPAGPATKAPVDSEPAVEPAAEPAGAAAGEAPAATAQAFAEPEPSAARSSAAEPAPGASKAGAVEPRPSPARPAVEGETKSAQAVAPPGGESAKEDK